MQHRVPVLLACLALVLFAAALAVASPFEGSGRPEGRDGAAVRLTRVDLVIAGGMLNRRWVRHVVDRPRLQRLGAALPSPLPASRTQPLTCNDCYETTVTVRAADGRVRVWRWTTTPPRGVGRFADLLHQLTHT